MDVLYLIRLYFHCFPVKTVAYSAVEEELFRIQMMENSREDELCCFLCVRFLQLLPPGSVDPSCSPHDEKESLKNKDGMIYFCSISQHIAFYYPSDIMLILMHANTQEPTVGGAFHICPQMKRT